MQIKVRDIDMYYEEAGSGRPLLMLHGSPGDHRQMTYDMEPLFQNRDGWRRVYPDLPGMGKTRGADWITHQDHMLDVTLEFMDAVAPGQRFAVAGASYGGYLARGIVYRRGGQLDGLMLDAPAIAPKDRKPSLPQHRVIHTDEAFLNALTPNEQTVREVAVAQSMLVLEAFRASILPGITIADHAFLKRLNQNYHFTFDVDQLTEPFPGPTIIMTGRFDHWCGYRDAYNILDNYPRGTFIVFDRAGHGLAREQQTLFRTLVSEWLDRVEEYAGDSAYSH